jgi:hypothetical protein
MTTLNRKNLIIYLTILYMMYHQKFLKQITTRTLCHFSRPSTRMIQNLKHKLRRNTEKWCVLSQNCSLVLIMYNWTLDSCTMCYIPCFLWILTPHMYKVRHTPVHSSPILESGGRESTLIFIYQPIELRT